MINYMVYRDPFLSQRCFKNGEQVDMSFFEKLLIDNRYMVESIQRERVIYENIQ